MPASIHNLVSLEERYNPEDAVDPNLALKGYYDQHKEWIMVTSKSDPLETGQEY